MIYPLQKRKRSKVLAKFQEDHNYLVDYIIELKYY